MADVFGRALAIGASFFGLRGLFIGDYCRGKPVVSDVLVQVFAVVWAVIVRFLANAAEEIPDTNAGGAPPNVVRADLGKRDGAQTDRCGASPGIVRFNRQCACRVVCVCAELTRVRLGLI